MKRLLALIAAVLLGAAATPPPAWSVHTPPLARGPGYWSFRVWGVRPVTLAPGRSRVRQQTVPHAFLLAAGAKQEGPSWYLLHLDYRIVIAQGSGSGSVYLSVSTNGATSAQIRFDIKRRPGRHLLITSDSLGLVAGHVVARSDRRLWRGHFDNYMQDAGVRGGWNSLTIRVEQYGAARISRATVLNTSGIRVEHGSPARLGVQAHVVPSTLTLEGPARVDVIVKNVGATTTRPGTVRLLSSPGLETRGLKLRRVPALHGGEQIHRVFHVRATSLGPLSINVLARAGLSYPMSTVVVRVTNRKQSYVLWIAVPLIALLGAVTIGAYFRRRSRTSLK